MKTAIVTGASRGIGKSTAELLVSKGYKVIGVYLKNEELAKALQEKYKDDLIMVRADVGDEKDVDKVFEELKNKFDHLDVLVNNAGINLWGKIEKFSTENWDRMMAVNLKSIFLFTKKAIPLMKKSDDPSIINITSRLGERERIEVEFLPYSVAKAAVTALSIGLSRELKDKNIRVNTVVPAPTKTDLFDEVFTNEDEADLIKRGKLGKPEEVAELVWQLVSDKTANEKLLFDPRIANE